MNSWFARVKKNFFTITSWFIPIIFILIVFLFIVSLLKPQISKIYKNTFCVAETSETNLSIQDKKNIDNLISKHKIIPISDIYDNTLSYYNTLITILVAILGVFTFVAWFSVKNKVKAEIEESVRETLNSNTYKELLDAKLNKIIRDYIPDYIADPDTMVECLPIIQKNIETIISGMKDKLKEEISNDVQEKVLESSELKLNKEKSTKTVKGEQNGN